MSEREREGVRACVRVRACVCVKVRVSVVVAVCVCVCVCARFLGREKMSELTACVTARMQKSWRSSRLCFLGRKDDV